MPQIVMLGPSLSGKGGIASVVNIYRRTGFFERWGVTYLATHVDGSPARKITVLVRTLGVYLRLQLCGEVVLLHVHVSSGASFWRKSLFIWLAGFAQFPVVLHVHSGAFGEFYGSRCGRFRKYVIRRTLGIATVIITVSHALKKSIEHIDPNRRVVVVPNSVEVPTEVAAMDNRRSTNIVLFLGKICAKKGAWDLLEAAACVKKHFPDVRVMFAGNGEINELSTRATALGIASAVDMRGWIEGSAKLQMMAECAVIVLPSYTEGLPMTVLEAMATGAPIVATKVGGIPDVVEDGVDGLLVEPGDIEGLAHALEQLLASSELRAKLSLAAKSKVVERFTPQRVIPAIEGIYRELGISRTTT